NVSNRADILGKGTFVANWLCILSDKQAYDSGILTAHQAQMKQQPRSDVYEMVYPFLRRSAFWF
ncbi:MAG: hypothetical protein N0E55_06890, partial [Candidatus Thiodiazotropha taylori]|nr:hypothetical protein [Candidatus Thiodiazotropha taylori]MCW4252418.1 hypothetical protein [Candidatus Thiodiazotropha taylori]